MSPISTGSLSLIFLLSNYKQLPLYCMYICKCNFLLPLLKCMWLKVNHIQFIFYLATHLIKHSPVFPVSCVSGISLNNSLKNASSHFRRFPLGHGSEFKIYFLRNLELFVTWYDFSLIMTNCTSISASAFGITHIFWISRLRFNQGCGLFGKIGSDSEYP